MSSEQVKSMERFYNAKTAEGYNGMMKEEMAKYTQDLAFLLKSVSGQKGIILDVSAGTGDMLLWIENNRKEDFALAGIDISSEMLHFARQKLPKSTELRQGSMEDLAHWKDGSCCAVLCNYSIHHLKDCSKVVSECARVLAKDGVLYLSAWEGEGVMPEEVKGVTTYYHSKQELNSLATNSGFEVVQQRVQTEEMYEGFSMASVFIFAKKIVAS